MRRYQRISLLLLILSLVLFLSSCGSSINAVLAYGAEGSDSSLLVVQRGNLFGYADPTGKIIIKPQYEDARPFYEGLAAVNKDGKYGYIDKTGKVLLPFRFVAALDFHNGKAIVSAGSVIREGNKLPGYKLIDEAGSILKDMDYIWVGDYSEGTMVVLRNGKNDLLYLDENYNEVDLPGEGHILAFHDGISDVMANQI